MGPRDSSSDTVEEAWKAGEGKIVYRVSLAEAALGPGWLQSCQLRRKDVLEALRSHCRALLPAKSVAGTDGPLDPSRTNQLLMMA